MKNLCLAVILVVLACVVLGQDQPGPREKTLIAPVFGAFTRYHADIDVMEVSGLPVTIKVENYTAQGQPFLANSPIEIPAGNQIQVNPVADMDQGFVDDGWAKLTYPANRQIHAVSVLENYRNLALSAQFLAVAPTREFRLFGWYRRDERPDFPRAETALIIVNPTQHRQAVQVSMHLRYPDPEKVVVQEWEVGPRQRLSRFISELLPLEDEVEDPWHVIGSVRVRGETVIAVNALNFYWKTGNFVSVPVVAVPTSP